MISFNDVKRTDRQTHVFFPNAMHDEIRHFLQISDVPETEYELLTHPEAKAKYYPDRPIGPAFLDPRLENIREAWCDHPCLIVSHMDETKLRRKLWSIHKSEDASAWRRDRTRKIDDAMRARSERLKGWLPELERESEDIE